MLAFTLYYALYYQLHEDWQRARILFMLERSLANADPVTVDAKPFLAFARQCVRVWRGGRLPKRPLLVKRELLARAVSVPPPTNAQYRSMLIDLQRLGARKRKT